MFMKFRVLFVVCIAFAVELRFTNVKTNFGREHRIGVCVYVSVYCVWYLCIIFMWRHLNSPHHNCMVMDFRMCVGHFDAANGKPNTIY